MPSVLPVRSVTVIFRPLIQPHMEPRHNRARRAEPNRSWSQLAHHQFSNRFPEQMSLRFGRIPDKCSKMSVSRFMGQETRHNQNCVMVQVWKREDIVLSDSALEVLSEST